MSTDVSVVRASSIIALMMERARTSETSVDIQLRTRQYIPEEGLYCKHVSKSKMNYDGWIIQTEVEDKIITELRFITEEFVGHFFLF
jgi:hypothetical protein